LEALFDEVDGAVLSEFCNGAYENKSKKVKDAWIAFGTIILGEAYNEWKNSDMVRLGQVCYWYRLNTQITHMTYTVYILQTVELLSKKLSAEEIAIVVWMISVYWQRRWLKEHLHDEDLRERGETVPKRSKRALEKTASQAEREVYDDILDKILETRENDAAAEAARSKVTVGDENDENGSESDEYSNSGWDQAIVEAVKAAKQQSNQAQAAVDNSSAMTSTATHSSTRKRKTREPPKLKIRHKVTRRAEV